MKPDEQYEPVIGLEVHAQVRTATKAFCGCSTRFGDDPNTNVCPVCLGLPGALPVLNRALVECTLRIGLATDCRIAPRSTFARKNYFYPDLPKGYQISQYEDPLCAGGEVDVELEDGSRRKIRITRIHMEEDAGKSIHDRGDATFVDVNRCGVPLMEIVSEPDIRSPREAVLYLMKIRQIVTYLGICDGNMEEGSLRCDANVSIRRRGDTRLGTKTELKNMNSYRFVERALEFEIGRQIKVMEEGGTILQETLLWDAERNVAVPMRGKEEAHDYRYFPEPDLVPVLVDEEWLSRIRADLPELPTARRVRFADSLGLPQYDAQVLTAEKSVADYFEAVLHMLAGATQTAPAVNAKVVSNWIMTDVLRVLSERKIGIENFPVTADQLAGMIRLIQEGTISGKIAKEVFAEMLDHPGDPAVIVREKGWLQVSDTQFIEEAIEQVLGAHDRQVAQYLSGNEKVFGFFVGETMKRTQGKANPALVNQVLRAKLAARKEGQKK